MKDKKEKKTPCASCIHMKKVLMEDLKDRYTLRCGVTKKFMEEAKTSCKDYEAETWERFLESEEDEEKE